MDQRVSGFGGKSSIYRKRFLPEMVKAALKYFETGTAKTSANLGKPRLSRGKGYAKLLKPLRDEPFLQIQVALP